MNYNLARVTIISTIIFLLVSCKSSINPNADMINLLSLVSEGQYSAGNPFSEEAKLNYFDSLRKVASNFRDSANAEFLSASTLLELGDERKATGSFESLLAKMSAFDKSNQIMILKQLAMSNLRIGERTNCLNDHSGESCIFPIAGRGVHADKTGSEKAIELYERILETDSADLESRWLLNIAYMTIGGYPQKVPASFLIKGLDTDTSSVVKPFIDLAVNIGLNTKNLAGGSIIDDFNNDGYFDLITSSWSLKQGMHYCRNNSNGTFTEVSDSSGLGYLTGGLNIMQTDYNNDGLKDIFVLRGAWKRNFGREPNSLLRNNGDGTFTDVTIQSKLLSFHPTQTATWNDFNNDGWLDVFIGNESPVSDKMKTLLIIAAQVQKGGKNVTDESIQKAKEAGATDIEIHDTVLIAALFCLYNRYVDGLSTVTPTDPAFYKGLGERLKNHGYNRLPQGYEHLKSANLK